MWTRPMNASRLVGDEIDRSVPRKEAGGGRLLRRGRCLWRWTCPSTPVHAWELRASIPGQDAGMPGQAFSILDRESSRRQCEGWSTACARATCSAGRDDECRRARLLVQQMAPSGVDGQKAAAQTGRAAGAARHFHLYAHPVRLMQADGRAALRCGRRRCGHDSSDVFTSCSGWCVVSSSRRTRVRVVVSPARAIILGRLD